MPSQVIEKFQSPFDNGDVLDGNIKNSIAPLMVIVATGMFWLSQKVCLVHLFLKAFVEGFPKTCDMPHFLVIEKIRSPSNRPPLLNCDPMFSITTILVTKNFGGHKVL